MTWITLERAAERYGRSQSTVRRWNRFYPIRKRVREGRVEYYLDDLSDAAYRSRHRGEKRVK